MCTISIIIQMIIQFCFTNSLSSFGLSILYLCAASNVTWMKRMKHSSTVCLGGSFDGICAAAPITCITHCAKSTKCRGHQQLRLRQKHCNYYSNTCGRKKKLSLVEGAPWLKWPKKKPPPLAIMISWIGQTATSRLLLLYGCSSLTPTPTNILIVWTHGDAYP